MRYSEDAYLESSTASELVLSICAEKQAHEARWVYSRVTEIAVRPYACTVLCGVATLMMSHIVGMSCNIRPEPVLYFGAICGGTLLGGLVAYCWNRRWYRHLNYVFAHQPNLFETLQILTQDDPSVARPIKALTLAFKARNVS